MIVRDVGLEESNLPENFEADYPGYKRDRQTGKYQVYGFELCQVLAHSAQKPDALENAESIMGIILFLDFFRKNPHVDISSGRAMWNVGALSDSAFWEQLDAIIEYPIE